MREIKPGGRRALIVAPPGRFRDCLQVMVTGVLQFECTVQDGDGPTVLRMAAEPPPLVLLDIDLPNDAAWAALQHIKARWPETRCIVLVNNDKQRRAAQARGADAVLVKGFTGMTLAETVAELLPGTVKRRKNYGVRR